MLLGACKTKPGSYEQAAKYCLENKETFERIDPVEKDTTFFEIVKDDCIEGYQLPNFTCQTIEGKTISTESLKGKISIITFWFETCAPCVAEMPGFNQIKAKYGTEEVNYLAIGNDNKKDIQKFIQRVPFNFDLVANGETIYRNEFKSYWGYPFTIITNRENLILKSFGGGSTDSTAVPNLIGKIEPVLAKERLSAN